MAENDNPERDAPVDSPGRPGDDAPASAQGQGAIGGRDDKGVNERKDKTGGGGDAPSESGKGINPVQHSE
jgi:hypothetical protein